MIWIFVPSQHLRRRTPIQESIATPHTYPVVCFPTPPLQQQRHCDQLLRLASHTGYVLVLTAVQHRRFPSVLLRNIMSKKLIPVMRSHATKVATSSLVAATVTGFLYAYHQRNSDNQDGLEKELFKDRQRSSLWKERGELCGRDTNSTGSRIPAVTSLASLLQTLPSTRKQNSSSFLSTPLATSSRAAADDDYDDDSRLSTSPSPPSWIRRRLLYPIGVTLPLPRALIPSDPALQLPKRAFRQRQADEIKMRQLVERAAQLQRSNKHQSPQQLQQLQKALGQEMFQIAYGKGVTPQEREDFLVRYGCTGWNDTIVEYLLELAESRGMVEIGAGHGQWARALNDAYQLREKSDGSPKQRNSSSTSTSAAKSSKHFDFVLAYDDQSNLPLNTHIYNQYTQPHHDYFGTVHRLHDAHHLQKIFQSWTCRGRILLLVYPPPGPMAKDVLQAYIDASPLQNDTMVYVGEGRGGANGDDAFFDLLSNGEWVLVQEMAVTKPPGDKGYETLLVLQRQPKQVS
jgi:hypothetical protein